MRRLHGVLRLCVALGAGACTSPPSHTSELAVRRVWEQYLTSKQGQFAQRAGDPTPHWDAREQARWPMYDLAGYYVADGAIPEVLSVTPVNPRADTAYRIVTRFWPAGPSTRDASTTPQLTMTVYARRAQSRWVLANALPYTTASWKRETRGRVTFFTAPTLHFTAAKAVRSAAFVDSLATAFSVAPPPHVDYYATESVDHALEVLGVVFPQRFGAAGGFAKPVNLQVFSGIPALGEEYRHELVHVVLLPVIRGSTTSLLASEGVATWFGGTAGRDYTGSVRHMDSLRTTTTGMTLQRIIDDMRVPSEIRNAAGAVLAEMVNEAGGVEAVREYLRTPTARMRDVLMRLLARPWDEIVVAFEARVTGAASRTAGIPHAPLVSP